MAGEYETVGCHYLQYAATRRKRGGVALSKDRMQSRWLLWNPTLQRTKGGAPGQPRRQVPTEEHPEYGGSYTPTGCGFAATSLRRTYCKTPLFAWEKTSCGVAV